MVDNNEDSIRLKQIFSANLNYYMALTKKSRDDISKALKVPYMTVSDWCRGFKYPRMDKIEKLANLFGIKMTDLIEEKDFDNLEDKDEVWEIRAELQQRPELKVLFDMSKKATKEDVEKAIQMMEIFIGKK